MSLIILVSLVVSLTGVLATHSISTAPKQVWWSRYAAESRPFGTQKSWSDGASQDYQQKPSSSGYKAKSSSWNKQSFGGSGSFGTDQSWNSKGSGAGGNQGGGSWGAGKKSQDSGFNVWSGKQSQDSGLWPDQQYQYQDSGAWSDDFYQYQDGGSSWLDKQYQNSGKSSWGANKQYQDVSGSSLSGKNNQKSQGFGSKGLQYQDYGVGSWSDKKGGQGGKTSWSNQQYQDSGSWSDNQSKGPGVNSWTAKKNQGGKTSGQYKQYQDTGLGYVTEDYYDAGSSDYYQYGNNFGGGKKQSQFGCQCEEKLLERVQDLEKKVYEMYLGKEKLTTKVWELVNKAEKAEQSSKQRQIVSFSAQASKNLPYLMKSEVIKFDEVLVNNGGAYDPHSGIFYAPVPGVYLFSTTILSGFNSTIESMITLNGQEASLMYSGAYKNRGSGSNTVILNLRKGDEVAVAVFYDNGNYVHGKWSTFSGALLETY